MGQGKSKLSDNNDLFQENPDIIKKKNISRFKCILLKDNQNLLNKLGKNILLDFDDKELKIIRKELSLISINYDDIIEWKFDEIQLVWLLCFKKYTNSDITSNSDSLELIEFEDDIFSESHNYQILFKFNSVKELTNIENSIFIYFGIYMIENKMISISEYNDWFLKYHKKV
jgi:hypothetical protein